MASIPTQIANNILETVRGISGVTITKPITARRPLSLRDRSAYLFWISRELVQHQQGKTVWMEHYQIDFDLQQDANTATPIDERIDQESSTLIAALMEDAQRGVYTDQDGIETTNPLAIDTLIGDTAAFPLESGREGFTLHIRVQHRTATFDLFNQ